MYFFTSFFNLSIFIFTFFSLLQALAKSLTLSHFSIFYLSFFLCSFSLPFFICFFPPCFVSSFADTGQILSYCTWHSYVPKHMCTITIIIFQAKWTMNEKRERERERESLYFPSYPTKCQFHQHFTHGFFVKKAFLYLHFRFKLFLA